MTKNQTIILTSAKSFLETTMVSLTVVTQSYHAVEAVVEVEAVVVVVVLAAVPETTSNSVLFFKRPLTGSIGYQRALSGLVV